MELVPPFAKSSVPVTPVVRGRPVQLVRVPLDGVPRTGVVSVGLLNVPPVTVLPVKVNAAGSDKTTAPVVGDEVISFAVPVTELTAPPLVDAMVIAPPALVIVMFDPAVRVDLVKPPVEVLPMRSCPSV